MRDLLDYKWNRKWMIFSGLLAFIFRSLSESVIAIHDSDDPSLQIKNSSWKTHLFAISTLLAATAGIVLVRLEEKFLKQQKQNITKRSIFFQEIKSTLILR